MEIVMKNGGTLGIGSMPGRKRQALYRMHGCHVVPIAYFATDEDAEWAKGFLRSLCDAVDQHRMPDKQ